MLKIKQKNIKKNIGKNTGNDQKLRSVQGKKTEKKEKAHNTD